MAAINKRKILASAQRHLQKGALEKALKEYQRLLEADPRDSNIRLKIGDLQLRRNQPDDAIDAYLKVADQFMRDGFDAKAVAIYKQVTKIDAKRYDVYLPLAELYQRLGLTTEAMVALQAAADGYQGEGKRRDALDLLRKMSGLDPSNVPSRLKVADLLAQESLTTEAVAEYDEIVAELERQGDWETQIAVYERILEADPTRLETAKLVTTMLLERNQNEQAEHLARSLIEANPDHAEANELVAKVLEAVGKRRDAAEYFRNAARAWRELGDEAKARDLIQRHVSDDGIDFGDTDEAGDDAKFGRSQVERDAPFDDPPTTDLGDLADPDADFDVSFDADSPSVSSQKTPASEPVPEAPAPPPPAAPASAGIDVEQVLAEASVYARYGKHEKAIEALHSVLEIDGQNPDALEQLGDTLIAAGHETPGLEAWNRAIDHLSPESHAERIESLRSRIAARNASSAPAKPPAAEPEAPEPPLVLDEPVEIDLDAEVGPELVDESVSEVPEESAPPTMPEEIADAAPTEAAAASESAPVFDEGIEIELDFGNEAEAPAATSSDDASEIDIEIDPVLFGDSPEEEASDAEPAVDDVEAVAADAPPASTPEGASTSTSERISEELEEADFYFNQDLFQEAREIYERVLLVAPNHPGAMLRIGEIDAALADAAEAAANAEASSEADSVDVPADEMSSDEFVFEIDEAADSETDGLESTSSSDDLEAALAAAAETVAESDDADDAAGVLDVGLAEEALASESSEVAEEAAEDEAPDEIDIAIDDEPFAFGDDEDDTDTDDAFVDSAEDDAEDAPAADAEPAIERAPVDEPATDGPETEIADVAAVATMDFEADPPEALFPTASPDDSFDLAAELSDAFDPGATASGLSDDDEGTISALFSEFKRGVEATLGDGDIETHFDLGIAYREMGLHEDAIGEFRYGLESDSRRLDALHMMASCALELGRAADAQSHLEQALSGGNLPETQEAAIRFDLGRAYASGGDIERALVAFRRVAEIDPNFRDVGQEIITLETSACESAETLEAEAYESFDDVIESDAVADEVAAPTETFESFEEFQDTFDDETDPVVEAPSVAAEEASAAEDVEDADVDVVVDDEDAADEGPPSDAEDTSGAGGGAPRRRRKVSFI